MSLPDDFKTIRGTCIGEFKDKGSKFIAYVFPAEDEIDFKRKLKEIKKEHSSAAHVCWAFVCGANKELEKSSDDREPSGSAGRPILNAINSCNLQYVAVAVVRYFGGKLLGVPGLIHAYHAAAIEAIKSAQVIEKQVFYSVFVAADFTIQHDVIRICKQHQVKFYPDTQNQLQGITFEVSPSKYELLLQALQSRNFTLIVQLRIIYV